MHQYDDVKHLSLSQKKINFNYYFKFRIQELMEKPWLRLKEYMNLLGSLQLHTAKEHPDQANIKNVMKKTREVHLYIKQVNLFLFIEP
jgi:hypothetical protein